MSLSPVSTTSADPVFLDANILLEIILERPHAAAARKVLDKHDNLAISALTAHLVVHFGQAVVDLPVLHEFLADYEVLDLNDADFAWAFANLRNQDFQDAVQVAVAIRHGCGQFVTFNRVLARDYNSLATLRVELAKE